jgi:hypothetical protein
MGRFSYMSRVQLRKANRTLKVLRSVSLGYGIFSRLSVSTDHEKVVRVFTTFTLDSTGSALHLRRRRTRFSDQHRIQDSS